MQQHIVEKKIVVGHVVRQPYYFEGFLFYFIYLFIFDLQNGWTDWVETSQKFPKTSFYKFVSF